MMPPILLSISHEMLLDALLLSSCFPILLHMDMVIGLEGMDGIIREFHTMNGLAVVIGQ